MKSIPDRIHQLRNADNPVSFSKIARIVSEEYGIEATKDMVQKLDQRHNRQQPHESKATDAARKFLQTSLALDLKKDARPVRGERRIIAIGDMHGKPHPGFLAPIVRLKPDMIIIGGDIFDQAQFSFHKPEFDSDIEEFEVEAQRVRAWLETLIKANEGCEFHIIRGNHDDRFYRRLADLLPYHMRRFFNDPLDILVAGLPINITKIEVEAHRPGMPPEALGTVRHLMLVGDAVVSHAHYGSAETFYDKWMVKWRRFLGWPELSLVVQHHTHQFGHFIREGGHLTLVDAGMVAEASIEDYKVSASAKWKPGTLGGVVFDQSMGDDMKWHTAHQSVSLIWPNPQSQQK